MKKVYNLYLFHIFFLTLFSFFFRTGYSQVLNSTSSVIELQANDLNERKLSVESMQIINSVEKSSIKPIAQSNTIKFKQANKGRISNAPIAVPPSPPGTPDLDAGSDTGDSNSDNITKNTSPSFSGTAEANTTVTLYAGTVVIGSTTASGTGTWTITSSILAEGVYNITATATDASSNTSDHSSALTVTIDITAPSTPNAQDLPSIYDTGISDTDNITNLTNLYCDANYNEANTILNLYLNGSSWVAYNIPGIARYRLVIPTMTEGLNSLTATLSDLAGNTSGFSLPLDITIDVTPPTTTASTPVLSASSDSGNSNSDKITNDTTPNFIGIALASEYVALYEETTLLGIGLTNGSGEWNINSSNLVDGVHTVIAKIIDLAGNTGPASAGVSVTIDSQIPINTTISGINTDTGISSTDGITSDNTLIFSGTAEINSSVEIFSSTNSLGTTTANGSGNWIFNLTSLVLADGNYSITAKATDIAGNTSSSSSIFLLKIDTTVPNTPGTPDLVSGSDSGNSNSDNITNITTPTFTGINVEAFTAITIYSSLDGILGTTTANSLGNWSFTVTSVPPPVPVSGDPNIQFAGFSGPLSEGVHSITITATDAAGNISSASSALNLTIDTSQPNAPDTPDLNAISDTGRSDSDNNTSNNNPTFSGTNAEAYSIITISSSVNGILGTTTANASGEWTFIFNPTPPIANNTTSNILQNEIQFGLGVTQLTEGTHLISATATDAAGNTSPASNNLEIVIDNTAPVAPGSPDLVSNSDTGRSNTDDNTNDNTPTFTGTAEAYSKITLSSSIDGVFGITYTNNLGVWTYTVSAPVLPIANAPGTGINPPTTVMTEGEHLISLTATDSAGNVSEFSSALELTIDITEPDQPSTPDLSSDSDSGRSDSDNVSSENMPTFTGTAEPYSIVEITSSKNGYLGSTLTNSLGNWNFTVGSVASPPTLANQISQLNNTNSFTAIVGLIDGLHLITTTATDSAGNKSIASEALSIVIDTNEPPAPEVNSISEDTGNSNSDNLTNDITLYFNGNAEAYSSVEVFIDNASIGTTITNNLGNWTYNHSSVSLPDATYEIKATATDSAGNESALSTKLNVTIETIRPNVNISSESSNLTSGAFEVSIELSEPSINFTLNDISVENGTASNFTSPVLSPDISGAPFVPVTSFYKATITPTANGIVTVDVFSYTFTDAAGNDNYASNTFSILNDETPPTLIISSKADKITFKSETAYFEFSEPVFGFDVSDITPDNASISAFTKLNDSLYTALITPIVDGDFSIKVENGLYFDAATNANVISSNYSLLFDNTAPVFTSPEKIEIDENSSFVAKLSATDHSTVHFDLDKGVDKDKFYMDPVSYVISFVSPPDAEDDSHDNTYEIIVNASDNYFNTSQTITVHVKDVNDNKPAINANQSFSIAENSAANSIVGKVEAIDLDVTPTVFQNWIISSNTDAFVIDENTGEITVTNSANLDREANASFTIEVTVSDGINTSSAQKIAIKLADENDVAPIVTRGQNFTIDENSAAGTSIGIVLSTDGDVTETPTKNWSIATNVNPDGDLNNAFSINPVSGEIKVNDSDDLDWEVNQLLTISVLVNDGVNTSEPEDVVIHLKNINDDLKISEGLSFSIDENSPVGMAVGTVTIVETGKALILNNWAIVNGNINSAFTINAESGKLTVANSKALDRETTDLFILEITVSDGLNTSPSQQVIIHLNDVNDVLPVIANGIAFDINEDIPLGTSIGIITASDGDVTPTVFNKWSIVSGNSDGAVAINALTGEITVAKTFDNTLAALSLSEYTSSLEITVSDGVNTSAIQTVKFTIHDVNNLAPVISPGQTFTIAENSKFGSVVGTLKATDGDSKTLLQDWKIVNNANNAFVINSNTGEVSVNNAGILDRETIELFTITVSVSDGVNTSTNATVEIKLSDLNDVKPEITAGQSFIIDENSASGTIVGKITALDGDVTATTFNNWKIVSNFSSNAFAINAANGELSVNNSTDLDFEVSPSITITVSVSDGFYTSDPKEITIKLNDVDETKVGNSPFGEITNLSVYPNPVSEYLNISAPANSSVQLIDLNGRIVKSIVINDKPASINVQDLKRGTYILKVVNKYNYATQNILVK